MGRRATSFGLLSCVLVSFLSSVSAVTDEQVYVVYMGSLPSRGEYTPMLHHMSILQEVIGESSIEGRFVRSYKRSFNGFAARLSESERERVAQMEGVVSVFPSKKLQIQTTASWDFMGLKEGKTTKRNLAIESDTIIGVIDTGIWPESESFSDKGFGPPPKKWKGVCSGGKNFTCNNKLIGARDYTGVGARDTIGHGTHTASTAGGNAVADTSFFGIGNGTVRGAVPASRIAAYKVCLINGCTSEAILAAFDDAIADGVDLITISIVGYTTSFEHDPTAIGAFHAMAKGILTVESAGNGGPTPRTIPAVAPWILTVAASNTNRGFVNKVVLGNGKTLVGKSVDAFDMKGKKYPLVYGKSAALSSACDKESAEKCLTRCLDKSLVKGKILVCGNSDGLKRAISMGAVACIVKDPELDYAAIHALPFSALSQDDFDSLVSYINSTKSPEATVLKSEAIFNQAAPTIASFSSRGPNTIAADILKGYIPITFMILVLLYITLLVSNLRKWTLQPDITAPGVEILAAYSPVASIIPPYKKENDTRRVNYTVLAGTSISCPHVAGVAAYVKTFYAQWSPSMIQSAIMTTAWPMNATGTGVASTEFAYGAGHVDPVAALNPGLVYELEKQDHIAFLCGMNYNATVLKLITGEAITNCTEKTLQRNLNYPSMSAKISETNSSFTITFKRTVTNVGAPNSIYKSKVLAAHGTKFSVEVSPSVLSMKSVNEKQSFTVTVTGSNLDPNLPLSANLIWSDGPHNVRSPIVLYTDGK